MYRVTVFDVDSTQENPIKPVEVVVTPEKLSQFLSEQLNDHTYVMVALIDTY